MSADDCVAILCSKVYPDAKEYQEYRVIWANCIENVHVSNSFMKSYFDNSMVFDDWKSAHLYAQRMDDKLMTEHGILVVRHKQDWTWDEVYMNKKFKQKRKGRRKE